MNQPDETVIGISYDAESANPFVPTRMAKPEKQMQIIHHYGGCPYVEVRIVDGVVWVHAAGVCQLRVDAIEQLVVYVNNERVK